MTAAAVESSSARDVPRVVWSWAFFDWANSAFTTLVATFIYANYFIAAFDPDPLRAEAWWGRAISLSAVVIALLSPVLGAAADRAGARKRFLLVAAFTCALATAVLAFVTPGQPRAALVALTVFVVANVSYELGNVFYNAFLPVIASPARIGRISGYGWGLGYVGGLACMAVALLGFANEGAHWFGLTEADGWNIRATNLLVAGWFLAFALPLALFVPERRQGPVRFEPAATFRRLGQTLRDIRRYRQTFRFLVARLIYNDGLITIFNFGGIYAMTAFGLELRDVLVFGIAINLAAGLGAIAFGFVDDRLGGKRTVQVSLVALSAATLLAVWAPTMSWLWVAGITIGVFAGPVQSASRSLMGRFVPDKHQAEFFGFYAFSGKATSFLAPLAYVEAAHRLGSPRAGVATVLVFFVVGYLLLSRVDEREGIAAAAQG